jgi:hypothetical protein
MVSKEVVKDPARQELELAVATRGKFFFGESVFPTLDGVGVKVLQVVVGRAKEALDVLVLFELPGPENLSVHPRGVATAWGTCKHNPRLHVLFALTAHKRDVDETRRRLIERSQPHTGSTPIYLRHFVRHEDPI